jgi:hypothetical protein
MTLPLTADQTHSAVTLPAATATARTLLTAYAKTITLHVRNVGSTNAITALRYRRYLRDSDTVPGPWIAVTASLPIAAGAAWEMQISDDCAWEIEVELTSTSGTTADISVVGV